MPSATRRTRSSLQSQEQSVRAGPGPTTSAIRQQQRSRASLAPENVETVGSVRSALSAATLPLHYAVTVAVSPLDGDAAGQAVKRRRIEGEEALADAWRRDVHLEGRLDDLRKTQDASRRSSANGPPPLRGDLKGKGKDQAECIWYTASLRFPCTCQLEPLSHTFAPGADPPLASELEPLSPHPSPRQIPLSAAALQPWATASPATDLDPAMDEMREFEVGWQSASGSLRRVTRQRPPSCDHVGDTAINQDQGGLGKTSSGPRGATKGLVSERGGGRSSRETGLLPGGPSGGAMDAMSSTHAEATQNGTPCMVHSKGATIALREEEAKRRKQSWRHLVCGDEVYGVVFSAIPLPHTVGPLPPPYVDPGTEPKLPASTTAALSAKPFILPRYFSLPRFRRDPSPYHPDISRFAARASSARVYWLIPVHGPVVVPGVNALPEPLPRLSAGAAGRAATKSASPEDASIILSQFNDTQSSSLGVPSVPSPSQATLSSIRPRVNPATRPAPLAWTPALLRHFWNGFVLPLQKDPVLPLGNISLAVSGPKPDPFIALKSPKPLKRHMHAGKAEMSSSPTQPGESPGSTPVRVEAGDHIRLYCDATHALRLRTWLYGIEVDMTAVEHESPGGSDGDVPADKTRAASRSAVGNGGPSSMGLVAKADDLRRAVLLSRQTVGESAVVGAGHESAAISRKEKGKKLVKLFDKVRLTLVGPRGEVLIVA